MFQHGSQIQTLDNQMNKFTAPAFPEKIKTLESIPETNRESYVDLSELSTQPNGIFPSPPVAKLLSSSYCLETRYWLE